MYLSDHREFVGDLAVVTTVLQFLSGALVCKQYVVNRTTAETSPLPFICGVISTCLWLLYGLTKNDNKIILVNTIGLSLMIIYSVVFYMFTYKKSSTLKQVIVTVVFLFFMIGYVRVETDNDVLLSRLGLLACSFTLLTIAAPMSKLFYVIRVQSTECLPFPMILMSLFVSTLWFLYGLIEEDTNLTIPNFVGGVLAVLQLALFLIYPSKPTSPLITKTIQA